MGGVNDDDGDAQQSNQPMSMWCVFSWPPPDACSTNNDDAQLVQVHVVIIRPVGCAAVVAVVAATGEPTNTAAAPRAQPASATTAHAAGVAAIAPEITDAQVTPAILLTVVVVVVVVIILLLIQPAPPPRPPPTATST